MGLFERIAAHMDEASQCGFDLEKYNKISQKIKKEFVDISTGLQSDVDSANKEKFLAKTWDVLHVAFFLHIFAQPNPKHALEEALLKFENDLKSVNEETLDGPDKKSFDEFKCIVDIARRLVSSQQ